MTATLTNNIIRFFVLLLVQVLVLNHVQLHATINPNIYILFVLLLPTSLPVWLTLVLGFILGLSVDFFSDTYGLHAAATVALAFARRPFIIFMNLGASTGEQSQTPNVKNMGLSNFITYAGVLTFIHHFFLFYVEAFKIGEFWTVLFRTIVSGTLTMLLMVLVQYVRTKRDSGA